jgi:hypothetical protein
MRQALYPRAVSCAGVGPQLRRVGHEVARRCGPGILATSGRFNDAFQAKLAKRIGTASVLTVNSGSSANLVAFSALTSHMMRERQLKPGDEVSSPPLPAFPTVNPVLLYGMVPVFVDIPTYTSSPTWSKPQSPSARAPSWWRTRWQSVRRHAARADRQEAQAVSHRGLLRRHGRHGRRPPCRHVR